MMLAVSMRKVPVSDMASLALMDPGTPAWWTLHVDLATSRVLDARLITSGHFINARYSQFNSAPPILPPSGARR